MNIRLAKLGNLLYVHCPAAYRPLYRAYKAVADRPERRLLREIVKPGMTVVDVGANIGAYSLFLARLVGKSGTVHAFEPEPRNFATLVAACRAHPNVRPNHAAVGAGEGMLKLHVADDLNVDHHTYDDGQGRRTIEVPVISLDACFPHGQRIDFIKMDIQGYEVQALRGARRMLAANPGLKLLLEFWPYGIRRAGCDPAELLALLADLGFSVKPINGARNAEDLGTGVNDYVNLYAYRT